MKKRTFSLGGFGSQVNSIVDFKIHESNIGDLPVQFEGTPIDYYYASARNGRSGEHHVMVPICDVKVEYDPALPQDRCTWYLGLRFENDDTVTIIAGNPEQLKAFCMQQHFNHPGSVKFQPEWANGHTACGQCTLCYKGATHAPAIQAHLTAIKEVIQATS